MEKTTTTLLATLLLAFAIGCASEPKRATVYVPTDRRIETCTNSTGTVCKAVPNAVFAEMLEKMQELKDLKTEQKVSARASK